MSPFDLRALTQGWPPAKAVPFPRPFHEIVYKWALFDSRALAQGRLSAEALPFPKHFMRWLGSVDILSSTSHLTAAKLGYAAISSGETRCLLMPEVGNTGGFGQVALEVSSDHRAAVSHSA